jgi:hypothetical protein
MAPDVDSTTIARTLQQVVRWLPSVRTAPPRMSLTWRRGVRSPTLQPHHKQAAVEMEMRSLVMQREAIVPFPVPRNDGVPRHRVAAGIDASGLVGELGAVRR